MSDVFLYPGEAAPDDVVLRDPTTSSGATISEATFASAGVSTVLWTGVEVADSAWSSAGTSAVLWNSTRVLPGVLASAGVGTALWTGVRVLPGVLAGAGTGLGLFLSDELEASAWTSLGSASVLWLSSDYVVASGFHSSALGTSTFSGAALSSASPERALVTPASAIINIVRDLIPDPVYLADGTPQPAADGGLFRAQTLYRFLNDGIKALAQKTGWVVDDWTAVAVAQYIPTYDINGQWHSFDEVFLNGWRLGRAAEGYLLWPQTVETGQSVVYALHSTTDHWNLRLFPAPNFSDPVPTLNGALTTASTSIVVSSVTGFMPYGFVLIDTELIQYYHLNAATLTLTGLVRGVGGTTNAAHNNAVGVHHQACWIKGVRTSNEIVTSTDAVEVPPAFQYALQLYVLSRCRQSENEYAEAAKLMAEFNQECQQRANDPRLKDSQGLQVRPFGDRPFGSMAWGRAVVS